jgi:hypothetical protein
MIAPTNGAMIDCASQISQMLKLTTITTAMNLAVDESLIGFGSTLTAVPQG